jgi:hypothetical protein
MQSIPRKSWSKNGGWKIDKHLLLLMTSFFVPVFSFKILILSLLQRMFRSPNSVLNKARTQFLNKQRMLSKVGSSTFSIVIALAFLVTIAPFGVRNISKTEAPMRFILYNCLFSWHFTFTGYTSFLGARSVLKNVFFSDFINCFSVDPYTFLDSAG